MADYYFDIETCSRTKEPDFQNDQIIAITYQRIDSRTGETKDELNILKSWESSEKDILSQFYQLLNPSKKWDFVPIGFNLSFDFTSLIFRFQKVGIEVKARDLFAEHPYIDMQHVLLLCNKGSFGGCTLERFAGKRYSGSKVIEWYDQKDYSAVEKYIEDEADRFISLYRFLVLNLPDVWAEFARQNQIIT